MAARHKPTLAVFKFASCDGCQLSLLDCEDELLTVAGAVDIVNFPEATRHYEPGPYDLSLVEGSITTPHDAERIQQVRRDSRKLVTIGACATSGGIQALRNYADVEAFTKTVYASPQTISTLKTSTAVSDHVEVDFELRGCPISKTQLLELLTATLHGRPPRIPAHSVCLDCKLSGNVCVTVARGLPCLGPVTHSGCDALCPRFHRGCFGCFGPSESPNPEAMSAVWQEHGDKESLMRAWRGFTAADPVFAAEGDRLERQPPAGPPGGGER